MKKINKIFAFGDSLINGYALKEEETWRAQLAKSMKLEIINAGLNGSTSEEGIQRLKKYQNEIDESDLIIMNFGTNDVFQDQDLNGEVNYQLHLKHMKILIDYFKKKEKDILILSVHHIIAEKDQEYFFARHDYRQYLHSNPNDILRIYNKKLKKLAEDEEVYYLDLFNDEKMKNTQEFLLTRNNSITDDGVHYSAQGSLYVAKRLEKLIKEEIQ